MSTKDSMNRPGTPGPLSCSTLLGGLIVTIIGGLVLAYLVGDGRFARSPDADGPSDAPYLDEKRLVRETIGRDKEVLALATADLDGNGTAETILDWQEGGRPLTGAIDVFEYVPPAESWRRVAHFGAEPNTAYNPCGFRPTFEVVDLERGAPRQLFLWYECPHKAANWHVFGYQGLGFLTEIASTGGMAAADQPGVYAWWPVIQDGRLLFLDGMGGLLECRLADGGLGCDRADANAPVAVVVEYWLDTDGLVQASAEAATLRVGELLHVRARSDADLMRDIFYTADGVLEPRVPFFLAGSPGQTTITIAGWRNDVLLRVIVE